MKIKKTRSESEVNISRRNGLGETSYYWNGFNYNLERYCELILSNGEEAIEQEQRNMFELYSNAVTLKQGKLCFFSQCEQCEGKCKWMKKFCSKECEKEWVNVNTCGTCNKLYIDCEGHCYPEWY